MKSSLTTVRHRWIGAVIVAALVAAAAPAMLAQGGEFGRGHGRRMGGPGGGPGRMAFGLRQLDLTDAQREGIRAIMQSHREEFQAVAARMREARGKLRDAVQAEGVNEEAIRAASSDLAQVQADGAVLRARVHKEVFQTLTPEQQEKARTLRAQAEQRMEERRQRAKERIKDRRQNPAQ